MSEIPSSDTTDAERPSPGGDRRWWLIGAAVALFLIIALVVFMATRGGGQNHGDMPGMNIDSMGVLAPTPVA